MTEMDKSISASVEKKPGREAKRTRGTYVKLRVPTDDPDARRLCAIILEVLGGVRTPTDAAGALGISVPRYYVLEARGLTGLLQACRRRSKGRKRTPEGELERLRREHAELLRERDRLGALLRTSQRAMGIPAPQKPERSQKKRKRRPQVRALRASRSLEKPVENVLQASGNLEHDAALVNG
jgi:hypothetical protein